MKGRFRHFVNMAGRPLDQNEIDGDEKAGTGRIGGQSNARKRRQKKKREKDINKTVL